MSLFKNWLRGLFVPQSRVARRVRRRSGLRFGPCLESLEDRTLFNTDVTISTAATAGGRLQFG